MLNKLTRTVVRKPYFTISFLNRVSDPSYTFIII